MSKVQTPPYNKISIEESISRTNEQLTEVIATLHLLNKANENRKDEITNIFTILGKNPKLVTDTEDKITDDDSDDKSEANREETRKQDKKSSTSQATNAAEEEKISAVVAIKTIKTINGKDDIGIEDFIKAIKKAKSRSTQPSLLLDLILTSRLEGDAEKAIRYQTIDSYDDLFNILRRNLKQGTSRQSLKSQLSNCKQGSSESVQSYTLRFRRITSEINYNLQSKYTSSIERKIKLKLEEEEHVQTYLSNLRKEIGIQVRQSKPETISEAQAEANELEIWLQATHKEPTTFMKKTIPFTKRHFNPARQQANTTPRVPNSSMPLADRIKIGCYKCGKLGHISPQCTEKTQNFREIQNPKRPPQVRLTTEEQVEELDNEEVSHEEDQEWEKQIQTAESVPFQEDSEESEDIEEPANIHYY